MEKVKTEKKAENGRNGSTSYEEMNFLVQNGEWKALISNDYYRDMSRGGRIITVHKAISVRLDQLNQHYIFILNSDSRGAAQFLESQINPLYNYNDYLSQALVWQEEGAENNSIPEELLDHLR